LHCRLPSRLLTKETGSRGSCPTSSSSSATSTTHKSATDAAKKASGKARLDALTKITRLDCGAETGANRSCDQWACKNASSQRASASKTRAEQTQDEWECHRRTSC
jgi:hypothetical protein